MSDIPNGFMPSDMARRIAYDEEGRMREFNISRQSTGGIGDANSLYATEAERFDSIAPFLARNKAKDAPRRNYVIQPGGMALFFDPNLPLDPASLEAQQYTVPSDFAFFGHDTDYGATK